jgi:hypothetical protein
MAAPIDMKELLARLAKPEPETKEESFEEMMRQVSMASALPTLTELNHEREYLVCVQVAQHVIGRVHQPDESPE